SPQIFRISGHYALAYMNVIPMLFYWTVKYHERSQKRYTLYIFLLLLPMSFLRLYFAAVSLIWVLCYSVAYFIVSRETPLSKIRHPLPVVLSVVAVFASV